MKRRIFLHAYGLALVTALAAAEPGGAPGFDPATDLLSLHYDHAPDKDDGQSAAADRTILESLYGREWIRGHVVAVSGAYGKNADEFNSNSDTVMNAAWNDCGGWLPGHPDPAAIVDPLAGRWSATLNAGGDIWVKEGGQSDLTAAVVRKLGSEAPDVVTTRRIHVVQHSDWNENQTTDAALAYTKAHTDYIRIPDANAYLNVKGGNDAFEKAALAHPVFGPAWKAAFTYYDPNDRLDYSDTGELMYILGLGEISIDEFRSRYLEESSQDNPKAPHAGNEE